MNILSPSLRSVASVSSQSICRDLNWISSYDAHPSYWDIKHVSRLAVTRIEELARRVEELEEETFTAARERHRELQAALAESLRGVVNEPCADLLDPHGWFVYILWGDNEETPLYVGQSQNVLSRLGSHLSDSRKRPRVKRVQLIRCESKQHMDRTESTLIREYRPPLNKQGVVDICEDLDGAA